MLTIALLAIGNLEHASSQIRHLMSLARGLDVGDGLNFAADLEHAIALTAKSEPAPGSPSSGSL